MVQTPENCREFKCVRVPEVLGSQVGLELKAVEVADHRVGPLLRASQVHYRNTAADITSRSG